MPRPKIGEVVSIRFFVEFRWLQLDESKEVFGECTKPTICANVGGKF